ncbi:MAG TPA: hypothetical protein PLJ60_17585 [Chryseolinea sp.]|nr:hypothetical protein [Chryseolinea sp.]
MTFNIRLGTTMDSVNQWPERTEKVFALIRKYDPDIIGIREATRQNSWINQTCSSSSSLS